MSCFIHSSAASNPATQSPAINLNLNINLPTSSSQQHQPATFQTIQTTTTPVKSVTPAVGQPVGQARTTFQLPPQQVFQQVLQPTVVQSGTVVPSSSVVSIPIAGVLSPNNTIHQQQQNPAARPGPSSVMLQMAPVVQTLRASAVASSHPVTMSVVQPAATTKTLLTTQVNSSSIPPIKPMNQTVFSQNGSMQIVNSQLVQTSQSLSQTITTQAVQQSSLTTSTCSTSQTASTQSRSDTERVSTATVTHTEQYSTSHNEPSSEPVDLTGPQSQFAQEIDSLTTWPHLQITPSSTTTTLTSTSPPSAALQSTSTPVVHSASSTAPSIPLQIACEDSTAVQSSLPLTSVTPHLTSILSELAQQASSDASHDPLHMTQHQFAHPGAVHDHNASLHLGQNDSANNIMTDPVSTATIVAGVSAEDIEGLDISIPPSLSGLSVTAADFLQEEIITGMCKLVN